MSNVKKETGKGTRLLAHKVGRTMTHDEVLKVSGSSGPHTSSRCQGSADDADTDWL